MTRKDAWYFVLVATVLVAGCALSRPSRFYVRIADALTSPSLTEPLHLVPWQFTLTEFTRVCPDVRPVARLETAYQAVELKVDERFPLAALSVVAIDPDDRALLDVPIFLEIENGAPPAILVRSDDADLNRGWVFALGAGTFRIRIQTLCGPRAETIIPGRVISRTSPPAVTPSP